MGRYVERVPPGFVHPTDEHGHPIPGEHYAILSKVPREQRTAYQLYEDTTEGTPISPVFTSPDELRNWLLDQGFSARAVERFLMIGVASSCYMRRGVMLDGIEGLAYLTPEQVLSKAEFISTCNVIRPEDAREVWASEEPREAKAPAPKEKKKVGVLEKE